MKKVVFITGATGLIGSNLTARILKDDPTTQLALLVRGDSDNDAKNRLEETLGMWISEADLQQMKKRIRVIRGDISLSRLGLSENLYNQLASQITHIIHSAATVQFQLPLECARLINLGGTKNVMALARSAMRAGGLRRVAYISTAYVCGNREGTISEEELECGQQFVNTYEQTKLESEKFIRNLMGELPLTIFRPSIVVGDSVTGRTTAFNVLYAPLKLIYRRIVDILPGDPHIPLDVVPVDFVTAAINHICSKSADGIGKTYHLTTGEDKATTTGQIVDLAVSYFNHIDTKQHILPTKFLPLKTFRAIGGKRLIQALEAYEPYLCTHKTFDNNNTLSALRGTKIAPPEFASYYRAILRYCMETDWGKRLRCAA
jgi:thioester reductase-like protein